MRTTVNIDDALLTEIRIISAGSHRPLGEVIDDALRLMLAERKRAVSLRGPLPTFGRRGLRPGVDLEDKEALADMLADNRLSGAAG